MIPAALKILPWKAILQFAAIATVLALVVWTFVRAWGVLPDTRHALEKAQAALDAEVRCLDGSECRKREAALQEVVGREQVRVVTAYEAELAGVRSRPPVTVRVCDRGSVSLPGAAGRGDAGAAVGGALPGQAAGDRDIGPELSALALQADEIVAACRQLQNWNRALAAD